MNRLLPLFLFAFGCLWSAPQAFGQDLRVIDTILKVEPSEGAKAYLTFCSNNDGLIGHAFVALSLDDPKLQSCKLVEAIGLHPDDGSFNRMKAIVANAKGGLFSDLQKGAFGFKRTVARLTVPLTTEQLDILKIKFVAYDRSGYQLLKKDCVTFCEEVAKILALEVPDRSKLSATLAARVKDELDKEGLISAVVNFETFPAVYIHELGRLNSK